jgi:hypothetical protein
MLLCFLATGFNCGYRYRALRAERLVIEVSRLKPGLNQLTAWLPPASDEAYCTGDERTKDGIDNGCK